MSTKKKQPLRPLPQLPATPRWAPSTPHALRALQQRSGGRRKSANVNRPDSARHILRQLARITAAQTNRRTSTPMVKPSTPVEKENVYSPFISPDDEDLENEQGLERPDFTLPIEEVDEGEDVGIAPTQHELPGGEDYTFKSIDFAAQQPRAPTSIRSERTRRSSRFSILPFPEEEDGEGDLTAQSIEYGRRAVSEGPAWDRYPRSSFGSIRMSEFGLEGSRSGKEPETEKSFMLDGHHADMHADAGEDIELEDNETENLQRLRRSISEPVDDGLFVADPGFLDDDNTFRLDFDQDEPRSDRFIPVVEPEGGEVSKSMEETGPADSSRQFPDPMPQHSPETTRQLTEIEAAAPTRAPRRKKLKLTRKGHTVPALPSSLIKRVAIDSMTRIGKKKPVISRESLTALEQASEWFFEQVGMDLEAYSNHAKRRKRIDDTDVLTLMRRQRMIGRGQSLAQLAEELLPDEVFLDLDLPDEA
ncbi:hypothetical protein EPUS_07998 [Endocarpon pusillum Z07020]|uniref:CENP-T/Histone H4 histone fold domain-containing protein n=1 Tax=Endocarpon pusillum (strain Z07020 / HMAS-L-300199) TaxID=1263415 RepID=U1GWF4_ENDPU|nr:uncharacterized protein EPUS_07998 [Endocarpon pusillum Z07020]ERF76818.1 hypothetical protein EPUS_07998 [Endocarpon pusillum Z07020]